MDEATAAVSWGPDRIDLFWVDAAGALVHRASRGDAWDAPESLGGTLASAPAATAWAVDQLQVFAVFPDGALWNRYWDGTSWHPWESLGGELDGTPGGIVVERRSHRRVGARHRRHDLASLVGRDALGRLGAPPALSLPRRAGRRTVQALGPGGRHRLDTRRVVSCRPCVTSTRPHDPDPRRPPRPTPNGAPS